MHTTNGFDQVKLHIVASCTYFSVFLKFSLFLTFYSSFPLSFPHPGFILDSSFDPVLSVPSDPTTMITRYDTDPDSKRYGLDVKEAGQRFYICDADGLITKVK